MFNVFKDTKSYFLDRWVRIVLMDYSKICAKGKDYFGGSHFSFNYRHHVFHEAVRNRVFVLSIHSAVFGPLQVGLVDVTVRVADCRLQGLVRHAVDLDDREDARSDFPIDFLDCLKNHLGVSCSCLEISALEEAMAVIFQHAEAE